MRRRILAVILTAFATLGATAAHADAARRGPNRVADVANLVTFTVDAQAEVGTETSKAIRAWDEGTVVGFARGACSGPYCIRVTVVDVSAYCFVGAGGCHQTLADGTHLVEVSRAAFDEPRGTVQLVVTHEMGHGLGLGHNDDPTSVMFYMASTQTVTDADRARLNAVWTPAA